jgi:hypothetical protein
MKKRHSKFLVILAILFVTCSCAARKAIVIEVTEERYHQTGIQEEDSIVVLLNEFLEDGNKKESESKESHIEKCMTESMVGENPHLRIMTAKKFRDSMFPGKSFGEAPRSPEALLPYLCNDTVKSQIVQLGVRYIVIVNMAKDKADKRFVWEDEGGLFLIGQSWTRYSRMNAHILDVRLQRKSGWVQARSEGECGYRVPVLYFIPFALAPYSSRTESEACSALGEATIKLINVEGIPNLNELFNY